MSDKIKIISVLNTDRLVINFRQLLKPTNTCVGWFVIRIRTLYGWVETEAAIYLNTGKDNKKFFSIWTDDYNNVIKAIDKKEVQTFKLSPDLRHRCCRFAANYFGNNLPNVSSKPKTEQKPAKVQQPEQLPLNNDNPNIPF